MSDRRDAPERLLTLREAAQVYGATLNSLQEAAARGALKTKRLGRLYTRISWMEEMLCRDDEPRPGFTSIRPVENGLSETQRASSALASLKENALKLRNSSRSTSDRSIGRRSKMTP